MEFKLDQVDDKTWFLVSLLGLAVDDKLEKTMAQKLHDSFLDPKATDITNDLRKEFVIAACEQIATDASAAPTNTVRATALLQPFYDAIITALAEEESTQAKAMPDSTTYSLILKDQTAAGTASSAAPPSPPPPPTAERQKHLSKKQITNIAKNVVAKFKATEIANKEYRKARLGISDSAQ